VTSSAAAGSVAIDRRGMPGGTVEQLRAVAHVGRWWDGSDGVGS
jgi:hypothetical protein